jgi:hypothetical protein
MFYFFAISQCGTPKSPNNVSIKKASNASDFCHCNVLKSSGGGIIQNDSAASLRENNR